MAEVLYRKWRPKSLGEVVGQGLVTGTLMNAVATGRLAHAYLFCGPRGTGKTSTARILAKMVNCLAPSDGEPDNTCDMCVSINEGRALDLIEIDAASNRGIDDIRDLSDKIGFAPTQFRYKVYIVDEVHMLTDQAFNALLKTLEEPPEHAIFILATTEIHKVPLTILSRCQRYDFRRISVEDIGDKLEELCAAEDASAEREALDYIARHSTGSLRDAENLLEQALVSYGSPLSAEQVRDMLELADDEDALDLCEMAIRGNVSEGLGLINEVAAHGSDIRQLQRGLMQYLRAVMLTTAGAPDRSGLPDSANERIERIAAGVDKAVALRTLKAFSEVDFRADSSSPLPLEIALLEASVAPQPVTPAISQQPQSPVAVVSSGTPQAGVPAAAPKAAAAPYAYQQHTESPRRSRPAPPAAPSLPDQPDERLNAVWPQILRELNYTGTRFKLGPLLRSSPRSVGIDGKRIVVRFDHASHIDRIQQELDNPAVNRQLKDVVSKIMGDEYELAPELAADAGKSNGTNRRAGSQSYLVRAAQTMGARLVETLEEGE